jgi:hypothetical protein
LVFILTCSEIFRLLAFCFLTDILTSVSVKALQSLLFLRV